MLDFHRKKRTGTILYSKGVLFIFAVIIIFLGNATWNVYQDYKNAKINEYRANFRLLKVEKRESVILERIDKLSTERGMEGELRKRFGITKDGENVIMIVDSDKDKDSTSNNGDTAELGIWGRFIRIFR